MARPRVDDDVRRKNITVSAAPHAIAMLKALTQESSDDGKRAPEGRIFDRLVEEAFFAAITRRVYTAIGPAAGFKSAGFPVVWSVGPRTASLFECDASSVMFSFVENARSVQLNIPMSIALIAERLIEFLRDGVFWHEQVATNVWDFPMHPFPTDQMRVQVVFVDPAHPDRAPTVVSTLGDTKRLTPKPGEYVFVREAGKMEHGHIMTATASEDNLVIVARRSDAEVMGA